jgi:quinol monooxygenase YgiN
MYTIVVEFRVDPQNRKPFRQAVHRQAANSLELEPQCRCFDVSEDSQDPSLFFLYELYDDEAAFRHHLKSNHFKAFDETVAGWVESKRVKTLTRTWPPGGH